MGKERRKGGRKRSKGDGRAGCSQTLRCCIPFRFFAAVSWPTHVDAMAADDNEVIKMRER